MFLLVSLITCYFVGIFHLLLYYNSTGGLVTRFIQWLAFVRTSSLLLSEFMTFSWILRLDVWFCNSVVWQWLIFYFDYFFYPFFILSLSFSLNLYFKINFKIYFPIFHMLLSHLILVLILKFLRFPQALITLCLLTSIDSFLNAVSSVVFVIPYCPCILQSLYSHPS